MQIERARGKSRIRRGRADRDAIIVDAALPQSQAGPDLRRCFICSNPLEPGVASWAARAGAGLCSARPVLEVCSAQCGNDPLWCGPTTCHAGW